MNQTEHISASQQIVTQWAGGETRQLAIAPVGATIAARDFRWRFSTATVLQSGPFTVFDGYSRHLAIRSGAGLVLTVTAPGAPSQNMQLSQPTHQAYFSGSATTSAELIAGPIRDINLMLSSGLQGGLRALQLTANRPVSLQAIQGAQWLIYADNLPAHGQVQIDNGAQHWILAAGDVLVLQHSSCTLSATTDCNLVTAWIADAPAAA